MMAERLVELANNAQRARLHANGTLHMLAANVDELLAEIERLKAIKIVVEATPKQWSTAQAPTMEALIASVSQMQTEKENGELRAALAPFAAYAEALGEPWTGRERLHVLYCEPANASRVSPTVADCRRARELLVTKPEAKQ